MAPGQDPTTTDDRPPGAARKVQLAGGSTYTVSLPKTWAETHGIEAGTELYLRPQGDGSLVVKEAPGTGDDDRRVRIRADERDPADLARAVRVMYVAGHDDVEFVADGDIGPAARRAVEEAVTVLVGAEVVEASSDRLLVRSLLNAGEVSVHQSVHQLRHVALAMHGDACEALFERSVDPERVVARDDEADRLFALVARYVNRGLEDPRVVDQLAVDRTTLFEYYRVARQLERVGDHAEKLATVAAEADEPLDGALVEPAASARAVVDDATAALVGDADPRTAYRALSDRDVVLAELERLDRSFHGSGEYRLSLVVDSLARTAEYGGNVAETAIRATATREAE